MIRPRSLRAFAALAVCLGLALTSGCATRARRHSIIDKTGIQVDLVRYVKGFRTEPQGFEHPAIISTERLAHILGAVEIETREKDGSTIRQPGIHPDLIEPIATALSEALREAGPDQEIGLQAVRKQQKLGVFHTKYLTTLLAYVKGGFLYLQLHRAEWEIPQAKEDKPLPEPIRDTRPMDYRVVSGDYLYFAGPQTLEIAWNNDVFRSDYKLPGSTGGEKRRREVLLESPIPQAERKAAQGTDVSIDALTPEQLRALADLEEDRRAGRVTEQAYQRARRELLRPR